MKKFALALAMVLTFGLLASCTFETTSKDVQQNEVVGTVTGDVTSKTQHVYTPGTWENGVFTKTEGASTVTTDDDPETESPKSYIVTYTNNVNSNYTVYNIYLYDKDYKYLSQISITQLGDKFYLGSKDITAYVSADPSGEFKYTYTDTETRENEGYLGKYVHTTTVTYNLTFTPAE